MSNKVDHLVNEIDIKADNYIVEGNPNARHILVIKTNELPMNYQKKVNLLQHIPNLIILHYD